MQNYVEQGQVDQIIVQIKDGSTWTAEIGLDGKVRLLKQLSDPSRPDEELPAEGEERETGEGEGTPADSTPGEGEAAEPQPGNWGEAEPGSELGDGYSEEELNKLIDQMKHTAMRETEGSGEKRHINIEMPLNLMKKLKDSAFKGRLSSVMLDNKYDRRVRGRTRGKLDMNRLYKVPTGSRNVFMQKESRKGKQYNVVLLIDESGSMGGRKAMLAAESAVFLTKQLTDIGVNVGIIGFESDVHVHKDLTEKPDYEYIYSEVRNARGGNCDYQGMRRAYHMLRKAPEGKKILIMLSDGNPTGFHNQRTWDSHEKAENILPNLPLDRNWETKASFHHLVKANKDVSSIGIGIQEGGWQVPDHTVIHDVGDLKKTIIAALRKHISRG